MFIKYTAHKVPETKCNLPEKGQTQVSTENVQNHVTIKEDENDLVVRKKSLWSDLNATLMSFNTYHEYINIIFKKKIITTAPRTCLESG